MFKSSIKLPHKYRVRQCFNYNKNENIMHDEICRIDFDNKMLIGNNNSQYKYKVLFICSGHERDYSSIKNLSIVMKGINSESSNLSYEKNEGILHHDHQLDKSANYTIHKGINLNLTTLTSNNKTRDPYELSRYLFQKTFNANKSFYNTDPSKKDINCIFDLKEELNSDEISYLIQCFNNLTWYNNIHYSLKKCFKNKKADFIIGFTDINKENILDSLLFIENLFLSLYNETNNNKIKNFVSNIYNHIFTSNKSKEPVSNSSIFQNLTNSNFKVTLALPFILKDEFYHNLNDNTCDIDKFSKILSSLKESNKNKEDKLDEICIDLNFSIVESLSELKIDHDLLISRLILHKLQKLIMKFPNSFEVVFTGKIKEIEMDLIEPSKDSKVYIMNSDNTNNKKIKFENSTLNFDVFFFYPKNIYNSVIRNSLKNNQKNKRIDVSSEIKTKEDDENNFSLEKLYELSGSVLFFGKFNHEINSNNLLKNIEILYNLSLYLNEIIIGKNDITVVNNKLLNNVNLKYLEYSNDGGIIIYELKEVVNKKNIDIDGENDKDKNDGDLYIKLISKKILVNRSFFKMVEDLYNRRNFKMAFDKFMKILK